MAELELEIEKFSEIDGIGAEELKDMLIPKLGTTLSRETKGYNVYVDLMQHKLNKLGYKDMEGKELKEDGVFGTNTEFAVNTFKETNKLWNSKEYRGKVGQTSYDMLYSGKARRSPGYDDQGTGDDDISFKAVIYLNRSNRANLQGHAAIMLVTEDNRGLFYSFTGDDTDVFKVLNGENVSGALLTVVDPETKNKHSFRM